MVRIGRAWRLLSKRARGRMPSHAYTCCQLGNQMAWQQAQSWCPFSPGNIPLPGVEACKKMATPECARPSKDDGCGSVSKRVTGMWESDSSCAVEMHRNGTPGDKWNVASQDPTHALAAMLMNHTCAARSAQCAGHSGDGLDHPPLATCSVGMMSPNGKPTDTAVCRSPGPVQRMPSAPVGVPPDPQRWQTAWCQGRSWPGPSGCRRQPPQTPSRHAVERGVTTR